MGMEWDVLGGQAPWPVTGAIMEAPESETVLLRPSFVGPAHPPRHG